MSKNLDVIENQLAVGDVKTVVGNGGKDIKYIELLFSPSTKVQFAPSDDKKELVLSVSDNVLQLPDLKCNITKSTLRDYIVSLKSIHNMLIDDESEV